jgi:aminoglycoside phosphotransferase (APT) family kinase protein
MGERPADPHRRMHDDEVVSDAALVRGLLEARFPQWADRPIERVMSAGTDNAMYRLGDDLAVRLPRVATAAAALRKEREWLPALAPHLPLRVPGPVAWAEPDDRYPYPWAVVQWLPGELAGPAHVADPVRFAEDLAAFLLALRSVDTRGGPTHRRGAPPRLQEEAVRAGIAGLMGEVDGDAVWDAWRRVRAAADHPGPGVWFHGDLGYLNLLARDGRLCGVIDWGTCGVGDPAIETTIAWTYFDADAREAYRAALDVDAAEWSRGQAWVLTGVFGVPYYRDTNPVLVADKLRGIRQVLAELG